MDEVILHCIPSGVILTITSILQRASKHCFNKQQHIENIPKDA